MFNCQIYDRKGRKRLFSFDADPVCAVDYCDQCGDCLVCDVEDGCNGEVDAGHSWVVYANDVEEFIKLHELDATIVEWIRAAVKGESGG